MDQEAAGQIVDRLKDEGDLIRNSGTNSIRSVKIQLDRFEDIFRVISDNIVAQTEMMMKSLDIQAGELQLAKESARREETQQQLDELEEKQDQTELEKVEKEDGGKEDREGKGLFAMLGGLGKLLMTGALIGGGLFVAYNFAKGFVDEMYNNAWTNFETGLVDFLTSIDFEALKNTFNNILIGLTSVVGAIIALRLAILGLKASIAAIQLTRLLGLGTAAPGAAVSTPRATPGAAASTPRAAPARDPRTGRFVSPTAPTGGIFSRLLNNPVARLVTRYSGPVSAALLLKEFVQLGIRGRASEEEMQELGDSGAFETFQEDWMNQPEYQQEIEERQLSPLEEASERLRSLREERRSMLSDAEARAAESSIPYREPNTSRIDEAIRNIEDEIRALEIEFAPNTKDDQSLLNTPFDMVPGSTPEYTTEEVANRFLANLFEAAGISKISSAADRVAMASNGGSPVVIVNAPTTNNNVSAPSTSVGPQTSVVQIAGGGGSSINPYGLTSAIS